MRNIYFIIICFISSVSTLSAQQNHNEEKEIFAEVSLKEKLPNYLQNIYLIDDDTSISKNYSSPLKKYQKGDKSYASPQRANYLFKETSLLKSIHPNYNYLGGNMDFDTNRIPSPNEIYPR